MNGVWVLNVPKGQYAKAWSGLTPKLYDEGVHVIHDSNFKFDPTKDFVNASDTYIAHGTLRILRVSPGQIARLTIDNAPVLLNYRKEPYIYNTALFQFNPNADFLLPTDQYIQNGTTHILSVPDGFIAKVWIGSKPILLEHKEEPYIFNDPRFKFEKATPTQLFERADTKLIQHGAIKRIIPPINEVAITNKDGKLEIINTSKVISSSTHQVVGFLNTGIQTLEFPSASAREKKMREDKAASPDQINYETYQTRDGLGVGVKILVAYRISNPTTALSQLTSHTGIVSHIEGLTTTDMGKTIQQLSSIDFLSSNQTKINTKDQESKISSNSLPFPSAPVPQNYADTAAEQLARDLKEYGIELIRLNVQEFKILDKEIQSKMSAQELATTNASTQQTVTDLETI
ncbi:MAG: hypothetical protein JO131_03280 [Gammaproteobacteria bacterium]|nr:hypothetical protein [Gammaproteobacteria bacterium]